MAKETKTDSIKMSFVSPDAMLKDLNGSKGRRGRVNPLYDEVVAKVQKIKTRPLALELTPAQRTGIMGKLKKMGLLATRKEPNRKYVAKFKILERNGSKKPTKIRMYVMQNEAFEG